MPTSFKNIKIDNNPKGAIKTGKWKNPGASLYDQILNSISCKGDIPTDPKELDEAIKNGDYMEWHQILKEAYMVAPVKDIKNSPYGRTPFSRSGCKYPHHVIKGDKMVVSVPGLRAAYICARNQGVLVNHTSENKQIVAHFNRHFRELGLKPVWHHGEFYLMEESAIKIENNFDDIYDYLQESAGIDLYETIGTYESDEPEDLINNINESVIEGSPDNPVLTSDIVKEIGGQTPEQLYTWMYENISYDTSLKTWHLKSAAELYQTKTGNCHDQSYFETFLLHSWGYVTGQLYFVEFSDSSNIGGNTHTLTWYKDDQMKYHWIENAWENYAGIHGPYDSIGDLKDAVFNAYLKDNDINQGKMDGIVFGTFSSYRLGMNLNQYTRSWKLTDDRRVDHDIPYVSTSVTKTTNPNDPKSTEAVDIEFYNKDGNHIGEASVSAIDTHEAFLYNIEVFKKYRGNGYGKSIMEYCLSHYDITELTVEPDNVVAINLYEKYGFRKYMDWEENGRKLIDMRRDLSDEIHESLDWIDRFVHDEEFRESYFVEGSHGKLKYDFRMGWDYNTGHQIKIVYSLDGINVTNVGDFYWKHNKRNRNSDGSLKMSENEYKSWVTKNIRRKGNNDHESVGQKVLAIEDIVTGKRLNSVTLISPICPALNTRVTTQTQEILNEIHQNRERYQQYISNVSAGSIDTTPSFKATKWFSRVTDPENGQNLRFNKIAKAELEKHGRGVKIDNIQAKDFRVFGDDGKYMIYHNPNRKQALNELRMREADIINYITHIRQHADMSDPENQELYVREIKNLQIIRRDINRIEHGKQYDLSMMKKYRQYDEGVSAGLTGKQLWHYYTYMDFRPVTEFGSDRINRYTEAISIDDSSTTNSNDNTDNTGTNQPSEEKSESRPKQVDKAESDKNGVRRKKLYMAFIDWCKEINPKNTFGSIFDKDAFHVTYPFVPEEMRYFYRLANPMLCVLQGNLTFFAAAELRKLNSKNSQLQQMMIFAATENDFRVFNNKDKKVYRGIDKNGALTLDQVLGETFDLYIQNMIKKGDILNAPLEESVEEYAMIE